MIALQHVTKEYRTKNGLIKGVDDVTLTIERGDIFGIVGYSGAGKSSLIRCMNLLERPETGKISVGDIDLTALNPKELRNARLKIGMIFQHFHLVNQKTVYENIAFSLKAAKTPSSKIKERVDELLQMVGLSEKQGAYPAQLSGGQKQRVGIARALANNPSVLLCDEATSALDPATTKSILKLLKTINEKLNITIVLITHEMDVVKEICNKMAIMQSGRIIEMGYVYDIFAHPQELLTKEFIDSVITLDIPEAIIDKCCGTIVQVTFKGEVAGEGIISDTLQRYQVKGNFLHGSIEYIQNAPLGIFIMELTGNRTDVQRALDYISKRQAEVEVIRYEL